MKYSLALFVILNIFLQVITSAYAQEGQHPISLKGVFVDNSLASSENSFDNQPNSSTGTATTAAGLFFSLIVVSCAGRTLHSIHKKLGTLLTSLDSQFESAIDDLIVVRTNEYEVLLNEMNRLDSEIDAYEQQLISKGEV